MTKTINTVSIIGLGSLGILYGEHFLRRMPEKNLRIIADQKRIDRYRKDGIFCNGNPCDFYYVTPDESVEPADLIIFAVKYNALKDAIRMAKKHVGPDTVILSVLNGIVSEQEIAEVYGADHMLYTVAQGMDAGKSGNRMEYVNKGVVCFGELDSGENSEKVDRVKEFFERVELPHEVNNQMQTRLWSKLMLNVGINQTLGYFNAEYRLVQQPGEARDMMISAMREVILVAEKEGVNLSESDIDYWMNIVSKLGPEERPSMSQDVRDGRPTEVALFAGTIVALGKKHGISVPVNEMFLKHFSEA